MGHAMDRVLLLVDDEENILRALKRALRRGGYTILTAGSGPDGLKILQQHEVGVIVSDQRMPGMIGAEFLSRARAIRPDSVRIMLSGYTELHSVTEAINQGAIYKFLTKPWEDELLQANIDEAFEYYELRRKNEQLAGQLAEINRNLEQRAEERAREAMLSMRSLQVAQDVLESLPVGIIGVDSEGIIVSANRAACTLLDASGAGLVGRQAQDSLPPQLLSGLQGAQQSGPASCQLDRGGHSIRFHVGNLGQQDQARGYVLMSHPMEAQEES